MTAAAGTAPKAKRTRKAAAKKATAPKGPKVKRTMSDEHKAALAAGRSQSAIVARYLTALGSTKKKRGRKVTIESLSARLEKAEKDLSTASPLERLKLTQLIKDTKAGIEKLQSPAVVDIESLEAEFVKVAKSYAESQGITRSTFLDCGVDKRVLVAAGI